MQNYSHKIKYSIESVTAIFIIAFVSILILNNIWVGFSLPLYILIMSLSTLLAIRFPRSGLYAVIFLTFVFERFFTLMTVYWARSEYKLYPLDLLLLAIFFSVFIQLIGRKIIWKKQKADWFFLSFAVLGFLYFILGAFVFKNDFSLAFSSFKYYVFYPILTWTTFLLLDKKEHLLRFGKFVLAGGVAIIFFILYGIVTGNGLWSEFTPLSTAGVRTLAFTHAFYLSMTSIVALVYISQKQNKTSRFLLFVLLIWTAGIVGSMMRHLWIALALAFGLIFSMALKKEKVMIVETIGKYFVTAILSFLFLIYFAFLFPQSALYDNMGNVTSMVGGRVTSITNSDDESIAWRSVVWKTTMKQYLENPVFGMGVGKTVSIEIGKYKEFVEVRNIHNSFLVLLVQLGIFGIGTLALAVFHLAKDVWRKMKSNVGQVRMFAQMSLAVLALHLVAFMFQPYLETNLLGIFFWINLGVLRRLSESE